MTLPAKAVARLASAGVVVKLRARLAEAEDTLRAIRRGEVDVVVVTARKKLQLFTLEGAEHSYRVLIESMNEGALILTADKVILYANECFARMVRCPLEQVTGSSFRRFLSAADRAALRPHMKEAALGGTKMQVLLEAADGSRLPAQISVREMAKDSSGRVTIGMVVTDMTEARRAEESLRALTQRVVQVQEAERGRLAGELHDNITQLLCGVQFSSQALVTKLAALDEPAQREAIKLRELLARTAEEVDRISRNLRPSELEHLGLEAALRATSREFSARTGVPVELVVAPLAGRLPVEAELALYRILQEALDNVAKHARARRVYVSLAQRGAMVQLRIKDDGAGFAPVRESATRKGTNTLGLLSMRERAVAVGGTLSIKSARRAGTEVEVRLALPGGNAEG